MRKITIKRPKRFEGSVIRWGLWLDEHCVCKIANGQTVTLKADEQEHRISLRGGMFTERLFDEVTIPAGTSDHCFGIDLIGVQSITEKAPLFRPLSGADATAASYEATVLRAGTMVTKQLLSSKLLNDLQHSPAACLRLVFGELQWRIDLETDGACRCVYEEAYYRFTGWEAQHNPMKALPLDHRLGKDLMKRIVLQEFVACLPEYRVEADGAIVPASRTAQKPEPTPKAPVTPQPAAETTAQEPAYTHCTHALSAQEQPVFFDGKQYCPACFAAFIGAEMALIRKTRTVMGVHSGIYRYRKDGSLWEIDGSICSGSSNTGYLVQYRVRPAWDDEAASAAAQGEQAAPPQQASDRLYAVCHLHEALTSPSDVDGRIGCWTEGDRLHVDMKFDWMDYGTGNRYGHAECRTSECIDLREVDKTPEAVLRAVSAAAAKHWPYDFSAKDIEAQLAKIVFKEN